jgi:hypothetical protein
VFAAGAVALAALTCGWLALGERRAEARAAGKEPEAFRVGLFDGAVACARCHTQPQGADVRPGGACEFVLMTEYAIWKVNDKHAQAYAILKGPRSKRMGELLGQDVLEAKTGCLNCHAMNFPKDRQGQRFTIEDGVSCGGCHGPSSLPGGRGWFGPHADPSWRQKSQAEKEQLGMRDLRDPAKRATLCLSCHVGDAADGKVVTHPMFAAGHPPLPPIEIATFSRNEPQHWRDAKDVPFFHNASPQVRANYHLDVADFQRTQLALVGSAAALRGTMGLAVTRADLQAVGAGRAWPELLMPLQGKAAPKPTAERARQDWPELAMAHSDCYGCHHDLAYPSARQRRGFGYRLPGFDLLPATPGRPLVRAWSLATADVSARYAGPDGRLAGLAAALDRLTKACNARPFGQPAQIKAAAEGVGAWSDELMVRLQAGDVKYNEAGALSLLQAIGKLDLGSADYETARQIGSTFQVAYAEWGRKAGDRARDAKRDEELKRLADYLNLQPYTQREERLKLMVQTVEALSRKPSPESARSFLQYVNDIGNQKLLEEMVRNDFLTDLFRIDLPELSKRMQTAPLVNQLQALSDKELTTALEKLSAYRPAEFKKLLDAVCAKLPPAPRRP